MMMGLGDGKEIMTGTLPKYVQDLNESEDLCSCLVIIIGPSQPHGLDQGLAFR